MYGMLRRDELQRVRLGERARAVEDLAQADAASSARSAPSSR